MMAMNDARPAPATPIGCVPSQPNINAGASTMLMITVAVCTTIPGLKFPVPRSAAPMTTIGNCSAIAGMNHERYEVAAVALSGSGLSELT
jgi:hypothetical protein